MRFASTLEGNLLTVDEHACLPMGGGWSKRKLATPTARDFAIDLHRTVAVSQFLEQLLVVFQTLNGVREQSRQPARILGSAWAKSLTPISKYSRLALTVPTITLLPKRSPG